MFNVKKSLSKKLPQTVRIAIKKILYGGFAHKCMLCESAIRSYVSHGGGPEVLNRRHVVGGMLRENDACPICGACDRTRLIIFYLNNVLRLQDKSITILHVAPEYGLYLWLQKYQKIRYIPADIDSYRYRHIKSLINCDLTDIPLNDNSIDVVICSHVIEHIPDDRQAMKEIYRILKPSGTALLPVPLAMDGKGLDEDLTVTCPKAREERFGQWDHVRLYDPITYSERLKHCGFDVCFYTPFTELQELISEYYLNEDEVLPIAKKSPQTD